jgi:hypothetical protein
MPLLRRVLGCLVVSIAIGAAPPAFAMPSGRVVDPATRSAARQLAKQAIELMQQNRWREAQDLLHRAYALVPAPTIATLEGIAFERMGRLVEAADRYEQARVTPAEAGRPEAFVKAAAHAEERLGTLLPRIPRLSVSVDGVVTEDEDLEVSIDERPLSKELIGPAVAQPINPGRHVIRASYGGAPAASKEIELREGEKRSVVLDVDPSTRPSSLGTTLGWTSIGLGAAGVVTGIVAGAIMLNEKATLDQGCQPTCPEDLRDEHTAFHNARTVSFVGWGVGIAGLALGTTLLLSASEPEQPSGRAQPQTARLDAVVGPASIALRGRF